MRYEEDGSAIHPGHRVIIERDETRWPSGGTWPQYRGRRGVVVSINRADHEIAVSFDPGARPGVGGYGSSSWFKAHELRRLD
jgi:hypothetical protein